MTNRVQQFLDVLCRTLAGDPYPSPVARRYQPIKFKITARKDPLTGALLGGKYRILELIGSGSMSHVYKANMEIIERTVAIKILKRSWCSDPMTVKRFYREAKAAGSLKHKNILTIHDIGTLEDTQPYFVMEFLEGRSLADVVKENGAIAEDQAIPIFMQICQAMRHAHERGLIHRDLKPENIMLVENSEYPNLIKLVDFGIVKFDKPSQAISQRLTQKGEIWGSPAYMSPEQCLGSELDVRTDIYSLGMIMYEILSSKCAFEGNNIANIISKQLNEMPPSFRSLTLKYPVSAEMENIVFRALSKEREKRHQSMEELNLVLEQCLKKLSNKNKNEANPAVIRVENSQPSSSTISFKILLLFIALAFSVIIAFFINHKSAKPDLEQSKQIKHSAAKNKPPAATNQPPRTNQPSKINQQQATINKQPPTANKQPATADKQQRTADKQQTKIVESSFTKPKFANILKDRKHSFISRPQAKAIPTVSPNDSPSDASDNSQSAEPEFKRPAKHPRDEMELWMDAKSKFSR